MNNTRYLNILEFRRLEYNIVIIYYKDMNDMEKYIVYTRALAKLYVVK